MAQPAEEKIPEIDHGVARRLFKEYVSAKKAAGQATKGLSYGKMLKKLSIEANRLKEKLGDDVEVRFEVKTIDGKVRLRALRDKGVAKVKPAPPKVPSAKPPPLPGSKKAAPVAPPVLAPPKVEEVQESSDSGEELAGAEISHDDLDQLDVTDDSLGPETLGADDSMAATLAALRAEEEEPLPPTAPGITESQKLSFATLGDIAKRMDQLADKRDAPKKKAQAEADAAVLEGESSGAADIRAVAASIKKKTAKPEPEPELGAPSDSMEGDSVPISLGEDDDDDDAPVTAGFGDQAAVAVVTQAHSALTGTRSRRTRRRRPQPSVPPRPLRHRRRRAAFRSGSCSCSSSPSPGASLCDVRRPAARSRPKRRAAGRHFHQAGRARSLPGAR